MSKKILQIFSLILITLSLSACQEAASPSSQTAQKAAQQNQSDNLPVLKTTTFSNQAGEFKLRSQTARYLNTSSSSMEIILSNTDLAFCQKQLPDLQEGDQQIKLIISAKDGQTKLDKGELINNPAFQLKISKITKSGESNLDSSLIKSLNLTDLNSAIVRGTFKTEASPDGKVFGIEGEFFSAICK